MYLLDTDTCIYLLNGTVPEAVERLRATPVEELGLAAITVAELAFGAERSSRREANLQRVAQFVAPFRVLPFDLSCAPWFASTKSHLARNGTPIGSMDLLIAAVALANGATLVTNNQREFRRVPGLLVENWTTSTPERQ